MKQISENLWGYRKRLGRLHDAIRHRFDNLPAGRIRVLDVGCGNGSQLAYPLARLGFQVTGLDPDAASIERGRSLYGSCSTLRFIGGTVEQLGGVHLFEVVVISEVLEHLENPEQLLRDAVQLVSPGGLVFVTVPNGFGEFEIDSFIYRHLRMRRLIEFARHALGRDSAAEDEIAGTENHTCGHVQFFTRTRLKRIFSNCGLQLLREHGASFVSGPLVCHTLGRSQRFIEWNARVADRLPLWLVSDWYFVLTPINTALRQFTDDDRTNTARCIGE